MTDYVAAYANPSNTYHREATTLAQRMPTDSTITDGVMRWNSNNTVPPVECVALAAHIGLAVDTAKCTAVRDAETRAFLADYRKRERNRRPSHEELVEMRAAFGPGAKVVNVVTGRLTRLN